METTKEALRRIMAHLRDSRRGDVTVCRNLDEAGLCDGAWTKEGAAAWARVLLRQGEGRDAPMRTLARLESMGVVTSREATLQALRAESSAMRQEATAYQRAAERLTVLRDWRDHQSIGYSVGGRNKGDETISEEETARRSRLPRYTEEEYRQLRAAADAAEHILRRTQHDTAERAAHDRALTYARSVSI